MKNLLLVIVLFSSLLLVSCKDDTNPVTTPETNLVNLEVSFYPMFGSSNLQMNKKFRNAAGDSVQFTTLKFYLSNIVLLDSTGKTYPVTSDKVMMVDFSDAHVAEHGSFHVNVKVQPGTYRGLKFEVGVPYDENHKDASTQSLPLGPSSGMFWSWNSGYIFHKIEGKADSGSGSANISFLYHIGGDNRKVTAQIGTLSGASVTSFVVPADGSGEYGVNVDYSALFTTGLTGTAPLSVSANTNERVAHGGALLDRVFLNTTAAFKAR